MKQPHFSTCLIELVRNVVFYLIYVMKLLDTIVNT